MSPERKIADIPQVLLSSKVDPPPEDAEQSHGTLRSKNTSKNAVPHLSGKNVAESL